MINIQSELSQALEKIKQKSAKNIELSEEELKTLFICSLLEEDSK